ncbi:BRO-N domain-containing protein [Staphylococcus arlettae]|uniref:BRO-N domain-containing protein n=1 Tax=Staphylococcus arlettae TaxID=29378 RepID=UPI0028A52278|nr:Bro-N domain-containing protein [Staphylococcus arlettae]MDT4050129.1 Bro-N domain-containing protein [Staphylococcus arlettae]
MIKQIFNDKEIRFLERDGEYWAVASDVAKILDFRDAHTAVRVLPEHVRGTLKVRTTSDKKKARKYQDYTVINEKGIYRLVMRSNKSEALNFQDWICDVLVELRQATGLKGYEAFRMLDKQKQKEAMAIIQRAHKSDKPINYIKANTIANKAVSTAFGYKKMIGKDEMTPDMLEVRQAILDDVVKLTETKQQFNLDIKVSKSIYDKYGVAQ